MRKLGPRARFIKTVTHERLAGYAWDVMQLASSHDPEHYDWLCDLTKHVNKLIDRVNIIERQLERIGAPQYRIIKPGLYAERVRGKKSAKVLKDKQ